MAIETDWITIEFSQAHMARGKDATDAVEGYIRDTRKGLKEVEEVLRVIEIYNSTFKSKNYAEKFGLLAQDILNIAGYSMNKGLRSEEKINEVVNTADSYLNVVGSVLAGSERGSERKRYAFLGVFYGVISAMSEGRELKPVEDFKNYLRKLAERGDKKALKDNVAKYFGYGAEETSRTNA